MSLKNAPEQSPGPDRRKIIAGIGATIALPAINNVGPAAANTADIVVIGAGAAGISATRELKKRGLSVVLIEADNRIGGRVHTDTTIFGAPYDVGAHWLHYGEQNPFLNYAKKNGFDVYPSPDEETFFVENREASDSEYEKFEQVLESALDALNRAGRRGRDVAPSSVVPDLGDWGLTANYYLGAYEMAKDFDHFSCADWYTAEDGTDWYCTEGFGALFAHSARDVQAELKTQASVIRWGGKGVKIETNRGTLSARAVVITVSTGVLAEGGIRFDPPLPTKKQEAFDQLTMGHYHHVALQLRDNFFKAGVDEFFSYKINKESNGAPKGFGALVNASGHGVTYCDIGGGFAKELSKDGTPAMYEFVLSELKLMFGSDVEKAIVKHHTHDWSANAFTRGAYASAEPGGAWARKELRRPEARRIWFAGEATSRDDWSTVAGAHKSGLEIAKKVARKFR